MGKGYDVDLKGTIKPKGTNPLGAIIAIIFVLMLLGAMCGK